MAGRINRRPDVDAHGFYWPERPRERYPLDADEVEACRAFLAQCDPTKRGRFGSYGLKHVIERAVGMYISNGACIQAALDLDLVVAHSFHGYSILGEINNPYPLNAWIGVSRPSVRIVAESMKRGVAV